GKPWLSAGWPLRILFVISAGILVAFIIGMVPVMLYRTSLAFVALCHNPPTLPGILALLPMAGGTMVGVWAMGLAHRALLRNRDQRRRWLAGYNVWSLVSALLFWAFGTFSIGAGTFVSFLSMQGP
ncbi:hypothetical protein AB4144_43765, partial [Rhizobiaceae sp. 2RAB30]